MSSNPELAGPRKRTLQARRRRKGAAGMIEFACAFMAFVWVLFGILDMCLAHHVLVCLNSVAAHAAEEGTINDFMGVVSEQDVKDAVQEEASRWRLIDRSKLTATVDLNHTSANGTFHTKVVCDYPYRSLLLPIPEINMKVSSVRVNQIQMHRPTS